METSWKNLWVVRLKPIGIQASLSSLFKEELGDSNTGNKDAVLILPVQAHCWHVMFNLASTRTLFCKAAFQPVQRLPVPGVVPPQCRTLHFCLLDFRRFLACNSILQPVCVPLDGSTTLWGCHSLAGVISHSCQFVSSGNLLRVQCPIIRTINEDIEQDWTQHCPLSIAG